MKTLITNVTIVDATGIRKGKVMMEDDKIKKVYKENGRVQMAHDIEIDGHGRTLMPGFVDMHAHLRDPGLTQKEDFNKTPGSPRRKTLTPAFMPPSKADLPPW